jgi:septin family protein
MEPPPFPGDSARESAATTEDARSLDKKLVENRFNVVVFGEFKRGKTTFVNALLGADILPTAVVPLPDLGFFACSPNGI